MQCYVKLQRVPEKNNPLVHSSTFQWTKMLFGLSTGSMTMNQYVRKIELGTNLPIKEHTASMKDWIKMLKHNYEVFDATAKAVEVKILNMLRYH